MEKGLSLRKKIKICENGHTFSKSSDCNSCPECEKENKPTEGFLSLFSAPVRRAFESENIISIQNLSTYTEDEILRLHGIGKKSLPLIQKLLKDNQLDFKK